MLHILSSYKVGGYNYVYGAMPEFIEIRNIYGHIMLKQIKNGNITQARNTTFTILTIKLFYAKIKREPNKHGELEKKNFKEWISMIS